jgi:transposase
MNTQLTTEEQIDLKHRHRRTKDRKVADKIKAALMFSAGYSAIEIARILLIEDDTVRAWIESYEQAKSIDEWLETNYLAYQGKLTKEEEVLVTTFVRENVINYSSEAVAFIQKKFNKTYTSSGVTHLLKRLNFVYKYTTLVPSKLDPVLQAEFKITYEKLEENLKPNEVILFGDGVHPQHNTTCTRAWIEKGKMKEMKSNTGRTRINLNGAYNPANQDLITYKSHTINSAENVEMIKTIEAFYPDKEKIYMIVDNAKYNHSVIVKDYLKTSRVKFIYLPPYSPNLNLIERAWKYMRKKVINNQYYEKFPEFEKAILNFFEKLPNEREELKQFIGTKMHLLTQS